MAKCKVQFIKIPRYDRNYNAYKEEMNPLPELFVPALKEIQSYMRAYGMVQKATKKLLPVMKKAFKSRNVNDLLDVGNFLSRLHIFSAHYFFERAFRLDPSQMKKRGLTN